MRIPDAEGNLRDHAPLEQFNGVEVGKRMGIIAVLLIPHLGNPFQVEFHQFRRFVRLVGEQVFFLAEIVLQMSGFFVAASAARKAAGDASSRAVRIVIGIFIYLLPYIFLPVVSHGTKMSPFNELVHFEKLCAANGLSSEC